MSSDPIRGDGWYETVPLGRVAWYNDQAPIDSDPEPRVIERRTEPAPRLAGHAGHVPPRRVLGGNAAAVVAVLWILALGVLAGIFAYAESASPVAALADIGLGLTVGWITVDLAKAYRRHRQYRY